MDAPSHDLSRLEVGRAKVALGAYLETWPVQLDRVGDLLSAALAFLSQTGWTRRHTALNTLGLRCEPTDPDACAFHVGAAMSRAMRDLGLSAPDWHVAAALLRMVVLRDLDEWNRDPRTTLEQVESAFCAAIYRARSLPEIRKGAVVDVAA